MIEQLVAKVFAARDAAHLAHWSTSSYSEHRALEHFYTEVVSITDRLVECYQGAFEKLSKIELEHAKSTPAELLAEQAVWLQQNLDVLSRDLAPLENIVAELLELYLSTLYKLNNLR